jgi:hypothetical protein
VSSSSTKDSLWSLDDSSSSRSVEGRPEGVTCCRQKRSRWPETVTGWPETVTGWPETVTGWPETVTVSRRTLSASSKSVTSSLESDTFCRMTDTVRSMRATFHRLEVSFTRTTVTVARLDETLSLDSMTLSVDSERHPLAHEPVEPRSTTRLGLGMPPPVVAVLLPSGGNCSRCTGGREWGRRHRDGRKRAEFRRNLSGPDRDSRR